MSTSDQQSLQSLAFLFLTFGHATDGGISLDEMRALATRLQGWAPDADLATLGEVIKGTVADYKAEPDKMARARQCCAALGRTASPEELARVLGDLVEIASADGTISDAERTFIDDTARDFGVAAPW
jgi:uncharacterized tellurite resistance protein B-like protein